MNLPINQPTNQSINQSINQSTYQSINQSTYHSIIPQSSAVEEPPQMTEDQKAQLKKAFAMFEKAGKGRIPARDLVGLLRCLGWNPSEHDLEEARQELDLAGEWRTGWFSL